MPDLFGLSPDAGLAIAVWIMAIIDFLMWPFAILLGWG